MEIPLLTLIVTHENLQNAVFPLFPAYLPLFSVLPWADAFHLAEHPAEVVRISHANSNANLIHSRIREPKQLLDPCDLF